MANQPDNRVLEVAQTAKCQFIITGDKEILTLKKFKQTQILTAAEFLQLT